MEAHPGAVEAYPEVKEPHLRAAEAYPGDVEAHIGAMEVHPRNQGCSPSSHVGLSWSNGGWEAHYEL